jgi:ADP-ribose pyrophosphatase
LKQYAKANAHTNARRVNHNGSAVIVPVFDDNTIALVKQYRHPARKYLYEVVAANAEAETKTRLQAQHAALEEELGHVGGAYRKAMRILHLARFLV